MWTNHSDPTRKAPADGKKFRRVCQTLRFALSRLTTLYIRHKSLLVGRKAKAFPTDQPTDGRTDTRSYRVASSQLKTKSWFSKLIFFSTQWLDSLVLRGAPGNRPRMMKQNPSIMASSVPRTLYWVQIPALLPHDECFFLKINKRRQSQFLDKARFSLRTNFTKVFLWSGEKSNVWWIYGFHQHKWC